MSLLTYIQVLWYRKALLVKLSVKPMKVSLQKLYETSVLKKTIESLQKDSKVVVTYDIAGCAVYISKC